MRGMDYRARWRTKRDRARRARLLGPVAGVVVALLIALAAGTGGSGNRLVWEHALLTKTGCRLALAGDMLVVAGGDGSVTALDVATGEPRWAQCSPAAFPVRTRPLAANGRVFVGADDGSFQALSLESGEPVWGQPFWAGGAVQSSPIAVGRLVIFGADDGRVYALDAASGKQAWRADCPKAAVAAAPTAAGATIYVTSVDGHLYAFDAVTGSLRWRSAAAGNGSPPPAALGSPLVVGTVVCFGADDGLLRALSRDDGSPEWQFQASGVLRGAVAHTSSDLFLSDGSGQVCRLRLVNGKAQWRRRLGRGPCTPPTLGPSALYVGTRGGVLYALDARTGDTLWSHVVGRPIQGDIVVDQPRGLIFLADTMGTVHALRQRPPG